MTVFDRLYKSHTVSSRAKRQAGGKPVGDSVPNTLPRTTPPTTPAPSRMPKQEVVHNDESETQQLGHTPTIILQKRHQSYQQTLTPQSLGLSGHAVPGNRRQWARDILEAFFWRDFGNTGKHWDVDATTVEEIAVASTHDDDAAKLTAAFRVEKTATWDWKDIYSVATAKAVIQFMDGNNDDTNKTQGPTTAVIRVQDYSYYVAG